MFISDRGLFPPQAVKAAVSAYDAEIAYADSALGGLLRRLAGLGAADRTIVAVVSDHGESMGELIDRYGYGFDHGEFLYRHQLRVPVVFRVPQTLLTARGAMHTAPVSLIDVMPTVLELLQITVPPLCQGISLVPIMKGQRLQEIAARDIFSERRAFKKAPRPCLEGEAWSLISGKRHLIVSTARGPELFDFEADPGETRNVYTQSSRAQTLHERLRCRIEANRALFEPVSFEDDPDALERLKALGYIR